VDWWVPHSCPLARLVPRSGAGFGEPTARGPDLVARTSRYRTVTFTPASRQVARVRAPSPLRPGQPLETVSLRISTESLGFPSPAGVLPARATVASTGNPDTIVPNGVYCGGSWVFL